MAVPSLRIMMTCLYLTQELSALTALLVLSQVLKWGATHRSPELQIAEARLATYDGDDEDFLARLRAEAARLRQKLEG